MAGASTVDPDWAPVARRIRDEATDSWNDKVAVDRFRELGVHFIRGRGGSAAAARSPSTPLMARGCSGHGAAS